MRNPIASLSDIHARGKDLDLFFRHWDATCRAVAKAGPRLILIPGDLWESANIGDASSMVDDVLAAVLVPMVEHLSEFPIVAIPGNHDIAADSARNALAALAALPNVTVYRKPDCGIHSGIEIVAVPWSWDATEGGAEAVTVSLIGQFQARGPRVLLAHGDILGGRMNKGKTCEKVSWGFSRAFLEALDVDRVIMGHYHARNMDLAGPGRGGYVGAVRQCNHGEEGNPQGFELWEPETNAVEWVEVESYPRHKTIVLSVDDALPTPEANLRIQTDGFVLDAVRSKAIQDAGGTVEKLPEPKPERVQRADIPADDLGNYRGLLDTFIATLDDIPATRQLCYAELEAVLSEGAAETEPEPEPDEIENDAMTAAF